MNKFALRVIRSFMSLAIISAAPLTLSNPSQAQSTSQCTVTFLPNTLRNSVSFTNGQAVLTLVREKRVNGSPSFDVLLNNSLLVGTVVTPAVIISGQLETIFQLRPNVYAGGAVEQAAAAVSCLPWRPI